MKIPVSDLEALAEKRDLSHVIVLAHDLDGKTDHVATYGRTIEQCSEAADFGNKMKDALGWPESLHAQPPRVTLLQIDIDAANEYLDQLGDIAEGTGLVARIDNVVRYYATQLGRWTDDNS